MESKYRRKKLATLWILGGDSRPFRAYVLGFWGSWASFYIILRYDRRYVMRVYDTSKTILRYFALFYVMFVLLILILESILIYQSSMEPRDEPSEENRGEGKVL